MGLEHSPGEDLEQPLSVEGDVLELVEDEILGVDVSEPFGPD